MNSNTASIEIVRCLKEFDQLFEGFFEWLAGQYDRETGGFYYAPSSIGPAEFKPDIESTAQAVYILIGSGLVTAMPAEMKTKLIRFFQNRQDPEIGYFYDPQNNMREIYRLVGRAVLYSKNCLEALGGRALNPYPGEHGTNNLPEYFKSPKTYRQWLNDLNWNGPWMAGDAIQVSGIYIRHFPGKKGKPFSNKPWSF